MSSSIIRFPSSRPHENEGLLVRLDDGGGWRKYAVHLRHLEWYTLTTSHVISLKSTLFYHRLHEKSVAEARKTATLYIRYAFF